MAITMEINHMYEWTVTINLPDQEIEREFHSMTANAVMREISKTYGDALQSVVLVCSMPHAKD